MRMLTTVGSMARLGFWLFLAGLGAGMLLVSGL
ncbi:hypothetical protein CLV40_10495 [Actinokineospora auranticolor]|uniref:Uncharacterized protein n=1 Tax=Actinokineospora auranticolor TaxID=155976 RepID=A0A2S6GUP9_9PSEU|nr:hypothetical protein CLV40_10495 [Actinokineospora auranticolor]